MEQINTGGVNFQVQTGSNNTNYFYPPQQDNVEPCKFNLPCNRNPYFTGCEALLAQIHETLGQTGPAAVNQAKAVSGLGGVGKTQTAIEYAYRYFHDEPFYEWVFWVNASALTLASSFGAIATSLALPNHPMNKLDENIAAVQHWLETHDRWLLIFDYPDSVTTTWAINFEAFQRSNLAAADLLNLSAFLAPDAARTAGGAHSLFADSVRDSSALQHSPHGAGSVAGCADGGGAAAVARTDGGVESSVSRSGV
jgi:hypothetical protein